MSLCEDELSALLMALAEDFGWRCRPVANDDRARVATGRVLSDSEPLHLLVRVQNGTLLASDGGETLGRLAEHGFDLGDPVLEALWQEALRTYRLQESDGRVFIQTPLEYGAQALNRFADALVALDGLRIPGLPARTRPRTLANEVEDYLRSVYSDQGVHRAPTVPLVGGLSIKPALSVDTPSRAGVLVQTGAATSTGQAYDHAFAMFSLAARGRVPLPNRLVILGGSTGAWNGARLRALSDIAFVGFWRNRDRLRAFLDGDIPDDPLMLPEGEQVPRLPSTP